MNKFVKIVLFILILLSSIPLLSKIKDKISGDTVYIDNIKVDNEYLIL